MDSDNFNIKFFVKERNETIMSTRDLKMLKLPSYLNQAERSSVLSFRKFTHSKSTFADIAGEAL